MNIKIKIINLHLSNLVKTNEQPMKGLDDYFRKTKAKPSIYWLPLTEEEVEIIFLRYSIEFFFYYYLDFRTSSSTRTT
jgi:hypothetical protein